MTWFRVLLLLLFINDEALEAAAAEVKPCEKLNHTEDSKNGFNILAHSYLCKGCQSETNFVMRNGVLCFRCIFLSVEIEFEICNS